MSKEYCEWAITEVQNYYNRLLILEEEEPWINLRLPNGQIPWVMKELIEWKHKKEEYNVRI